MSKKKTMVNNAPGFSPFQALVAVTLFQQVGQVKAIAFRTDGMRAMEQAVSKLELSHTLFADLEVGLFIFLFAVRTEDADLIDLHLLDIISNEPEQKELDVFDEFDVVIKQNPVFRDQIGSCIGKVALKCGLRPTQFFRLQFRRINAI